MKIIGLSYCAVICCRLPEPPYLHTQMQSLPQYSSLGFNSPSIVHVVPRSTHELVEIRVIFKPGVVVKAFLSEPQTGAMTQPAFGTPDVISLALV